MNKILIIFCGGTIASREVNGVRSLDASANKLPQSPESFELIARYMKDNEKCPQFLVKTLSPQFLSENATISIWNSLIELLKTVDFSEKTFSGVIITHGTDTLAYAAAMLSLLLQHTKIPVVLVASNAPLANPKANGHKNFSDAVAFICAETGKRRGVFVAYSYSSGSTVIYNGQYITQAQLFSHKFRSFNGVDYGRVQNGKFMPSAKYSGSEENSNRRNLLQGITELISGVMLVIPYVGLDYSTYNLDTGRTKVVLHSTYHSGTVCTNVGQAEERFSVKWFFQQCAKRGIQLYFAGAEEGAAVYSSAAEVAEMCLKTADGKTHRPKFLYDVSIEYAYAKLMLSIKRALLR